MRYIFDLDGTLIDSSERMYRLFCKLIPECALSKEEYWSYKRDKVNHKKLIEMLYPHINFDVFESKWMQLIEADYYLCMDENYADTKEVLKSLYAHGHELYLLTARQSKVGLIDELKRLELISYFKQVLTTEGKASKEEVLLKYSEIDKCILEIGNILISDMGKDIELGNKYGFHTVAITHGFMSEERLKEYDPKAIINELGVILGLNFSRLCRGGG